MRRPPRRGGDRSPAAGARATLVISDRLDPIARSLGISDGSLAASVKAAERDGAPGALMLTSVPS